MQVSCLFDLSHTRTEYYNYGNHAKITYISCMTKQHWLFVIPLLLRFIMRCYFSTIAAIFIWNRLRFCFSVLITMFPCPLCCFSSGIFMVFVRVAIIVCLIWNDEKRKREKEGGWVGWGFNVPFLVLKARHPTPQRIRTSLLVIQVQCFARSSPFLTELYCLLSLNSVEVQPNNRGI